MGMNFAGVLVLSGPWRRVMRFKTTSAHTEATLLYPRQDIRRKPFCLSAVFDTGASCREQDKLNTMDQTES